MRTTISVALCLLAFLLVSGCATTNDVVRVKQEGSEGTVEVYDVTFEQAWEISKTVFRWEGADAIEEHKDQRYMLTSSGMNMVSWGAVMGAWIEPVDAGNTRVTVVTKRRVTINIATTLTEGTYQKRFAQAVAIIKSGQPLPLVPPKLDKQDKQDKQ
ncbi:MAG: hypothetical protein RBR18_08975 [Desulfovibrionaceae bacterium]|jgi:hypothetical protein|uniref:hypothetical protein n=1 Tax=Desulfovibrio aminophilus TaxID=81425 RepID=UPI00040C79B3|nr:hypothetical protein [Desulfovibrio aminophilus]MDY0306555.1 hypothetical protein [Desulfovibrionaceae bacterium]